MFQIKVHEVIQRAQICKIHFHKLCEPALNCIFPPGKTGTPVLLHFSFFAATELSRKAVCSKATVKLRIRMVGSTELTRWRRRIKKNTWLFYEEGPAGRKRGCTERTQARESLLGLSFRQLAHVLLIFSI